MKSRKNLICLCNIAVALLAGAIFYLFFRRGTYFHSFLRDYFQYIPPFITVNNPILTVIFNHLGDFLWGYALCSALYCAFSINEYAAVFSFLGTTVLGASLEIMQKAGIVSGTFDYMDIFAEAFAAFISIIIIRS